MKKQILELSEEPKGVEFVGELLRQYLMTGHISQDEEQLGKAASILLYNHDNCLCEDDIIIDHLPAEWDETIWIELVRLPYKNRVVVAAALCLLEHLRLLNQ